MIPPAIGTIFPSLRLTGKTAVVAISDLKKILPSIEIVIGGKKSALDGELIMSRDDVGQILRIALSKVTIDESWYLLQVPGLQRDIQQNAFKSVVEHYYIHGYLEGLLPERPIVDEEFYLRNNPDVAAAVKAGRVKTGFDHFVQNGYAEGRLALPHKHGKGTSRASKPSSGRR